MELLAVPPLVTDSCKDGNAECPVHNGACRCRSGYYDDNGSTVGGTCQPKVDNGMNGCSTTVTDSCKDGNAECPVNNGACRCISGYYDDNGSTVGGTCQLSIYRPTIFITDVQAKSLTVTWVVESLQSEKTTLFTINLKTDRPAMDIVKTVKGFNVSTLEVKDLEEYWNYTVTLEMSTTAGAFISDPVNETRYLDAVLSIDHTYAVSVDVTPDQIYRLEVYAINSLDQKGTVTTEEIYAPAGIPPNTIEDVEGKEVISKVNDVSQTKITVTLIKEFFQQSQHGIIRATGLIVCAKDKCDIGASLSLHQFTVMKSWQIASKEGFPAYRVTRDYWLTEAHDTTRQRRRRSLTMFDFIIGAEYCTDTAYTDFCNGRLQPNMEYIIIATTCTSGGFLLRKHYGPFKTLEEMKCPESSTSTAAIIIGVVMGVIILVLATYAAYVTIQNRKHKAKKDTEPETKSRVQTFSNPIYINETFTDSDEQRLSHPKEESSANEDSQYSSLDETTRTQRSTYETLHAF